MKQILFVLFSILISLPALSAGGPICSSLFSVDPRIELDKKWESLVKETFQIPETQNILATYLVKYAIKNHALKNLSKKSDPSFEIQSFYRQMELINSLRGQERKDGSVHWINEALFSDGLKPLIANYQELVPVTALRARFANVFSMRVVQFMLNPSSLPNWKTKPVPAGLLAKIMVDGVEAHRAELNAAYLSSGQNKVRSYENFQRTYQVIFVGFMIFLSTQSWHQGEEMVQSAFAEQYVDQLDQMQEGLDRLDKAFEAQGLYKPK